MVKKSCPILDVSFDPDLYIIPNEFYNHVQNVVIID
jgi:hypothetical protein